MTPLDLAIVLIGLQALDAISTIVAMKEGAKEGNPILVKLAEFSKRFTGARWAWLVIAKVFAAVLIYLYLREPVVQIPLIVVYVSVVIWNFKIAHQRRKREH